MSQSSPPSSAERCPDCGGPLLEGTCAACAFGWMRESEAGAETAGLSIGRYQLLECLARGGMGVVYAARDTELRRLVALKLLRGAAFAKPEEVARFTLETRAAAALDHPHIVPVYEMGTDDGEPYFTMKLVDGQTLAERLRARGPIPAREAASLLAAVARAVEHAHSQGVMHRDLKPGNILLDSTGKPWLTDFGLAKFSSSDSGLTLSTDTLGTPHYMPPEIAEGRAQEFTAASDVWALGVILWEMIAGVPPFTGQSAMEVLHAVVKKELPPPPEHLRQQRDLLTIARRCLEKRPSDRIASAGFVADELERFLRGEPILSSPASAPRRAVKWIRRRPLPAALLALGTAFLVVSSVLWLKAERVNTALTSSNSRLGVTNVRLEQSLGRATAMRLASEARLQVNENPNRALLLAAAAAEMKPDGKPLPEAAAALFEVMQQAGGTNCSPAPEGELDDSLPTYSYPSCVYAAHAGRYSPDSRWLITFTAPEYYVGRRVQAAAIYDLKASDRSAPVRRWRVGNSGTYSPFSPRACWMGDSQRLVQVDGHADVYLVDAIGTLALSETGAGAPVLGEPPSRRLGSLVPPGDMEEPRICYLQMISSAERDKGDVRICVCWRSGPRYEVQLWQAGPGGLDQTGSVRVPVELQEDAIVRFSPQGRWVIFGARNWEPLAGDGACALVYDAVNFAEPPLRLLTDPATPSPTPGPVRDMLASSWLSPEFGSAAGVEDFVVQPHPGHRLMIHSLRGREPGAAVPGVALPAYSSRLMAFALSPDSRAVVESRLSHGVIVHPLALSADGLPVAGDLSRQVSLPGEAACLAVAFSPDNRWVFASRGQTIDYWRREGLVDGESPRTLLGCPGEIAYIGVSPDSHSLYAAGGTWAMRRWAFDGVTAGINPRQIEAPGAAVREVSLSPDGNWVAAACEGGHLLNAGAPANRGWSAAGRIGCRSLTPLAIHGEMATGTAFSRDGKWLASAGGTEIRGWNFSALASAIDQGAPIPEPSLSFADPSVLPQYDARLTWFPQDKLYCVHGGGGDLQWDFQVPDPFRTTAGAAVSSILYQLPAVALSPDGRFTAIARHGWDHGRPREGSLQQGNQVLLFDGDFDRHWILKHALAANFVDRTNIAISPDGRWLAAGGAGKPATVWDLNAADISASRREAPVSAVLSAGIAFSPDSKVLAIGTGVLTGNGPGTLNFWTFRDEDATSSVVTIRTPRAISTIAWHPDGRLVTAGGGGAVSVWETDVARLIRMARGAAGRELSPDERSRYGL